jgi:hypothetical protein
MTRTNTNILLHSLFEKTPSGDVRHCGWTGPDRDEAATWVEEMNACFPTNRHWFEVITRA